MINPNQKKKKNSIIGIGLIALDVILNGNPESAPVYYAGGSCGNVLTILSYLNFDSFPIARLAKNRASEKVVKDIEGWGVHTDLIAQEETGSTPVIIQRMKHKADGTLTHKFEFRNPETGEYLPSYKPLLGTSVGRIIELKSVSDFFYFDRLSRSSIDLAKYYKSQGSIIFFEPSSIKGANERYLEECIGTIDIIKFSKDRIPDFATRYTKGIAKVEIETLGVNGINFRVNDSKPAKWHHLPSLQIDLVQDTAGAGDWCTSGIILALSNLNNIFAKATINDWKNIINFGQALGAISCFFSGARGLMYNVKMPSTMKLVIQLLEDKQISHKAILKYKTKRVKDLPFESIASLL